MLLAADGSAAVAYPLATAPSSSSVAAASP